MGKMGKITQKDLENLFTQVDKRLLKKAELYIIGGAAAVIGYNVSKFTEDIDLDTSIDEEIALIVSEQAQKMGLDLYLSAKGVFFPPDGYRERMKFKDFPARNLRVYYLGQYDLAISKIDRGYQKDMDDIQAVHERFPYDLNELIEIFNSEYINVSAIGDLREKKMKLLDVIDKLFGHECMQASKIAIDFKPLA